MKKTGSALIALAIAASALAFAPQPASADAVGAGGSFVSVPYGRLLDATGATALSSQESRSVAVLGRNGIPTTGVGAVLVDVSVVTTTASQTNIRVWTTGSAAPTYSHLQVTPATAPRSTTVAVVPGPDGNISVSNSAGSTALNIDVQGYFTSVGPSGLIPGGFVPVSPTRLLSTSTGLGVPQAELGAGASLTVTLTGGGIPSNAGAIFAAIRTEDIEADGSLKIVAAGDPIASAKPLVTYAVGTGPNDMGASLPLSQTGSITIVNTGSSDIDLSIVAQGYFSRSTTEGGGFTSTSPVFVGTFTLAADETREVGVGGIAGVPTYGAAGAMLAVRVKDTSGAGFGYLDVWRAGGAYAPVGLVGWQLGDPVDHSTTVVVRPGAQGKIALHNRSGGPATVVLVLEGWFSAPKVMTPQDEATYVTQATAAGYDNDWISQAKYDLTMVASTLLSVTATETGSEEEYLGESKDPGLFNEGFEAGYQADRCKTKGRRLVGENVFHADMWDFSQTLTWCWRNGSITSRGSDWSQGTPGPFWEFVRLSRDDSTFSADKSQWIRGREGFFRQCVPYPGGKVCSHSTYAYIKHTVRGNGTYEIYAEVH